MSVWLIQCVKKGTIRCYKARATSLENIWRPRRSLINGKCFLNILLDGKAGSCHLICTTTQIQRFYNSTGTDLVDYTETILEDRLVLDKRGSNTVQLFFRKCEGWSGEES